MNVESMHPTRDDLLADVVESRPVRRRLTPGWFFASLETAQRIARGARQLYALSDAQLAARGLTREDIRTRLLQEYPDQ